MRKIITSIIVTGVTASSTATIINIPADYPTIQAGIAYSRDGDTVLVQPGIYYEFIDYFGRNVTVGSLYFTTGDTSYISSTMIDGIGLGPVVTFQYGENENAALVGFTLQNGYKDNGGGIRCIDGSSPVIRNNLIVDNIGYRLCGGIYCLNNSNPTIESNIIQNNNTSFYGGGIYALRSSAFIKNNIITGNSAAQGGGIYIDQCEGIEINGNLMSDNYGGGVTCKGSDVVIIKNQIHLNDFRGDGGGIKLYESTALITGNEIMNNYCGTFGGGINLQVSYAMIYNNIIVGNFGGRHGGGISLMESNGSIINNIIMGNTVEQLMASGGGVYLAHSECVMANLIIRENLVNDSLSQISTFNCEAEPIYCNIEGGWPGDGNIDTDPLLRDPENGDFHLMSVACGDSVNSPCIDTGDPNILDSLLDCSWGLGGIRSDMGAYGGGDSLMTSIFDNIQSLPDRVMLLQNYPNPFNAQTTITFILPESGGVKMTIYDLLGRRVETIVDAYMQVGIHKVSFDASGLSSGVYLYRLRTNDRAAMKRMLLLK